MSDPDVNKFIVTGDIYLWKYSPSDKNYQGFHLAANKRGCESLLELLRLIKNASWPSRKAIQLSVPGALQLRVPGCRKKAKVIYTKTATMSSSEPV